jgi:hypothetical protein
MQIAVSLLVFNARENYTEYFICIVISLVTEGANLALFAPVAYKIFGE